MNKVLNLAILFALSSLFTGCGMKAPIIVKNKNKVSSYETVRIPKLNLVMTAEIGENIYSKSYLFTANTYQIKLNSDVYNNLEKGKFDYNETTA